VNDQWILGIVAALIAAGVIGLWRMSITVGNIDTRIATWTKLYEESFKGLTERVNTIQNRQRDNEEKISQHGERLRIWDHIHFTEGKELP
jgi:deoxyhypusine synthase